MTATTVPPLWRTNWARREDDRRQRAYDDAVAAWHRHHEHLLRLQIEAATFHGCHPGDTLPVEFEDGEVVFRVVPMARLVEAPARHVRGLPLPDMTIGAGAMPLDGRLPRGLRVVAVGTAVVTDRRVAFAGADARREWWYADVTGAAHHPDAPLTLLHTSDGRRLAGLLVQPAGALNTRFYLTLAIAATTGRRAEVAAEVDTLLTAHRTARPAPPAPARPADAPVTALRPDRRMGTAVAAAVTLTVLTAGVVDAEPAGRPHLTETAATRPATTDRPGGSGAVSPAPATSTTGRPAPPGATPGPVPPVAGTRHPARVAPAVIPYAGDADAPAARTRPGSVPDTGPVPDTGATPTTAPPSSPAPAPTSTASLITVCADVLPLPIVDPILCPGG